jgi:rfaE bifunctional protein nucleotidyltransferase chain/domain
LTEKLYSSPMDFAPYADKLRAQGKTISLAHGVFDLLHIGHLRYLKEAATFGDILVVSITDDPFVNKGPGRPVFSAQMRAEMLAALDVIDYVIINHDPTAIPVINALRPNFYVKGQEYLNADDDVTGKITEEKDAVEVHGGHIKFTRDITFSSSNLLNSFFDILTPELKAFLADVKRDHNIDEIINLIDSVGKMRVLVVGDAIIDQYDYVSPMGRSAKENIIATKHHDMEIFAGGCFAAANHIANVCGEVELLTCLGGYQSHELLINKSLKDNVKLTHVKRPDAPTTRKRRYLDRSYLHKLFEVYYFNDSPLPPDVQAEFDNLVAQKAPEYDLVIVTDFGHGLIAPSTIEVLQSHARFLAVNAQSNSANYGYNLITRYHKADFICIDAPEARLAAGDKHGEIEDATLSNLTSRLHCDNLIITLGNAGCLTYSTKQKLHNIPVFTNNVIDTVGAGDAFFAIAAPIIAYSNNLKLAGIIGNAAGALKVGIVGHRSAVEKVPLIKFLTALFK